MAISISKLRNNLEQLKGRKKSFDNMISLSEEKLKSYEKLLLNCEEAQAVIQLVAKKTQEELEYHVVEPVNLALSAVFDDPYALSLHFDEKRGRTEVQAFFKRGDELVNPMTESGGGAVDIACFALRISLWNIQRPRSSSVFIFDEPFKNINDPSRELHRKTAQMVKMLCEKLNLQIIMVSQIDEMIEFADKAIEVKLKNKVSGIN